MIHHWRSALCAAVLPPLDGLDPGDFWTRFDAAAPLHLRLGLALASGVLVVALPRALGHRRSLGRLAPAERDRVLARADALPGLRDLLVVGKLVACFAYFDDDGVQARIRSAS